MLTLCLRIGGAAIYGAMEDAFLNEMKGKIRALGVSNFDANMLELLSQTSRIKPAVNQCRMTVGMFDSATAGYCKAHGITYQAYSTLHTYPPAPSIAGSTVIKTIAEAHGGVSNQQVVMRCASTNASIHGTVGLCGGAAVGVESMMHYFVA